VTAEFVTANYFQLLGAEPALGRWFTPDEETAATLCPAAILSYGFWQSRLGGDRTILGKSIWITNAAYTVAGVAPRGFTGALVNRVDLWLPFSQNPATGVANIMDPRSAWHYAIGRLRNGFTFEQALTEGASLLSSEGFLMRPLGEVRMRNLSAEDKRIVVGLNAAAAILLAIACLSVSGLLEIPAMILSWILSAAGAVMFLVWVAPSVRAFFVSDADAAGFVDTRMLAITAGAALCSALLGGLARGIPWWLRRVLAVIQGAVALVLLVGAGLFMRNLQQVRQLPFGVDVDKVFLVMPNLAAAGYSAQESKSIYQRLLEHAHNLPETENAALDVSLPIGGGVAGGFLPAEEGSSRNVVPFAHIVTSGYLGTLGAKVIEGRGFTPADRAGAPPVAMVTRRAALEYWPGKSAVGKCLLALRGFTCFQVVGVVENTRWRVLGGGAPPEVFAPLAQSESAFPEAAIRVLLIRTSGGPAAASRIVSSLRATEPELPYMNAVSLWSLLDGQTRRLRLGAAVFGLFGLVAAVLAAGAFSATWRRS
jgi:hypothetical protein